MSVLVTETSIFPNDLLEWDPRDHAERRWWVLYTRSRQEKAIARRLSACEAPFYLPLVSKTTITGGRKLKSRVPAFASYLFLFGSEEERLRALETNRISRILRVEEGVQLRFDLRQLRHLIETGAPLTVESRLTPGQRVRVRSGVFEGLEGSVLSRQGKTRLLVSVNFLQQGASVEIEDCRLEPITL